MLRRAISEFSIRCEVAAQAISKSVVAFNITKENGYPKTGSRIASCRPVVQESRQDRIENRITDCMMSAASASRTASYLKVLSAGAVKYVLTDFAPKFAGETGDRIEFTFGTIGAVQKRLANGETADIIVGTAPVIAQMEQAGVLIAGSRTQLGRTLTGICVRDGTP